MGTKNTNEVIVILAGGFTEDPRTGVWRSSRFDETPTVAEPGCDVRYRAAFSLSLKNPGAQIIVSGGRGQADALFPAGITCASIMKRELMELGLDEKRIREEAASNNTAQQLQEIERIAHEEGLDRAWIVTSAFHVARVYAMVCDTRLGLKKLLHSADIVSAENIAMENDQRWARKIAKAYTSEALFEIIARERRGVEMIKNGTYQYKL